MSEEKKRFQEKDRVRRKSNGGGVGTVQELREEVTGTSGEASEKGLMVKVLWDNGTLSYFSPEALEPAGK